ncbi:MAG: hypothetical protein WAU02_01205 [Candidatus Saccharimonadales bacterium]
MYTKLMRIWNNPTVRRVIVWALPFVVAWWTKRRRASSSSRMSR